MNTQIARYRFHPAAVAALAAVVFAGFAKTYYFRAFSGLPPLAQPAHVHGLIATVWIALHYTQARLVAAHRVDLHRRLGIFAAFVAALLAVQAAIYSQRSIVEGYSRWPGSGLAYSIISNTCRACR